MYVRDARVSLIACTHVYPWIYDQWCVPTRAFISRWWWELLFAFHKKQWRHNSVGISVGNVAHYHIAVDNGNILHLHLIRNILIGINWRIDEDENNLRTLFFGRAIKSNVSKHSEKYVNCVRIRYKQNDELLYSEFNEYIIAKWWRINSLIKPICTFTIFGVCSRQFSERLSV